MKRVLFLGLLSPAITLLETSTDQRRKGSLLSNRIIEAWQPCHQRCPIPSPFDVVNSRWFEEMDKRSSPPNSLTTEGPLKPLK